MAVSFAPDFRFRADLAVPRLNPLGEGRGRKRQLGVDPGLAVLDPALRVAQTRSAPRFGEVFDSSGGSPSRLAPDARQSRGVARPRPRLRHVRS